MTRAQVFDFVSDERDRQDARWGTPAEHPHEIPGWVALMRNQLDDADRLWRESGELVALKSILKAAALAVACMEQPRG